MRRTYPIAIAAALAAAAFTEPNALAATHHAATATSSSASSAQARLADPVGVNGVPQHELLEINQQVTERTSPTTLAGTALDTHAGVINLYVASSATPNAVTQLPGTWKQLVHVHHVRYGQAALNTYMADVAAITSRLTAAGVPVQSWWPDFENSAIAVSLYRPTPAQQRQADLALAGLPARITTASTRVEPIPAATAAPEAGASLRPLIGSNSAYDSSPWAGGDFIYTQLTSTELGLCTDSWPVTISSTSYVLTAGHCRTTAQGASGAAWYNGGVNNSDAVFGSETKIGAAWDNTLSNDHLDAQVIAASADPYVWSNYYPDNNTTAVTGSTTPPVGASVCDDGAYEGTICGATISSANYNACINSSDGEMCHLYQASKPAGEVLIGQGDSGGPDYEAIYSGQYVADATGVGLNSLESAESLACPAYTWRGNVCSDTMYFTSLPAILSNDNASLKIK